MSFNHFPGMSCESETGQKCHVSLIFLKVTNLFQTFEDIERRFRAGNDFSVDVNSNCRLFVVNCLNLDNTTCYLPQSYNKRCGNDR